MTTIRDKKYWPEYRRINRNRLRENGRARYSRNPKPHRESTKRWSDQNPERKKANFKLWRSRNKEHVRQYARKYGKPYYHRNRDKICDRWRKSRNKNRVVHIEYRRLLKLARSDERKASDRTKARESARTNLNLRIRRNLSIRLIHIIRGTRKSAPFLVLLGCSIEDFKIYIETKFEPGMNWLNWGLGHDKWHLDHIVPCALFDLTRPEHQRRCFHFSNYQPLWAPENYSKGGRATAGGQFQLL